MQIQAMIGYFREVLEGLITAYGGSNSHMAIRCVELSIPAAIGCGERMFEKLKKFWGNLFKL